MESAPPASPAGQQLHEAQFWWNREGSAARGTGRAVACRKQGYDPTHNTPRDRQCCYDDTRLHELPSISPLMRIYTQTPNFYIYVKWREEQVVSVLEAATMS